MYPMESFVYKKLDIRWKDVFVLSFTFLYFLVLALLYLSSPSSDYTTVGSYATVLTHLAVIPVLFEVRSREYLALYVFTVAVVSTIYHLSQVGWWWSVPSDNPWRRLDHGFSTLLVFLLSVTLWYNKIPWSWVFVLSFVIMGVCTSFHHLTLAGLHVNTWIGGVIATVNFVFVVYESVSSNPSPRRKVVFLWTALSVFAIAIFFYLFPVKETWDWYFHSAWHVAVFASAYLIIRSEEYERSETPEIEKVPLIREMSKAPLRF